MRPNIPFKRALQSSTWRKIAIGTWGRPSDPTVYSQIHLDATQVVRAVKQHELAGERVTPLSLLVHAVARTLADVPEANMMLRLGRLYPRENVNVMVPALVGHRGDELTGILLRDADRLDVRETARRLNERARQLWSGRDAEFQATKRSLAPIPGLLMRPLFGALGFVLHTLNVWVPGLAPEPDFLGSVQVTTIGEFGIDEGYGPLDPYARHPFLVVAGAIRPQPVAVDGKVEVRPVWPINFSADHRVGDAFLFGRVVRRLRRLLSDEAFLMGGSMKEAA